MEFLLLATERALTTAWPLPLSPASFPDASHFMLSPWRASSPSLLSFPLLGHLLRLPVADTDTPSSGSLPKCACHLSYQSDIRCLSLCLPRWPLSSLDRDQVLSISVPQGLSQCLAHNRCLLKETMFVERDSGR